MLGQPEATATPVAAVPSAALPRAALLLAPAMVGANALHYLFNIAGSRLLGPAAYGALGALLGLVLLGAVPGLAVQSVAARHTALRDRDGGDAGELWGALLRVAAVAGLALSGLVVLGSPALARFLHLGPDQRAAPLALAACLVCLPVLSALHGLLQGRHRWRALAGLLLLGAGIKLVLGIAFVLAGFGLPGALAGAAIGYATEAGVALALARPGRSPGGSQRARRVAREAAGAAVGILALSLLTNIDLLLARHVLAEVDSGLYAAGSVVAKIAYWAPQAVVLAAYPRLAVMPDPKPLLAQAAAAVVMVGAAVAAGTVLAGDRALLLVFGQAYAGVSPWLPAFAVLGTLLALAQLVLFADLAEGRGAVGAILAAAVAAEAVLLLAAPEPTVGRVVVLALMVLAAALAAATAARAAARRERPV